MDGVTLFSDLVGHERVKWMLTALLQQKGMPLALLFAGPAGVGKRTFAQRFSAALLGGGETDRLVGGLHPDYRELAPQGKGVIHSYEAIARLVKEDSLRPFIAARRVVVIDDAEQMLPASSHALLKTLEEPQGTTHFILISALPAALLPTLRSRLQVVPFFPLAAEQVLQILLRAGKYNAEECQTVLQLGQGSLQQAQLALQPAMRQQIARLQQLLVAAIFERRLLLSAALQELAAGLQQEEGATRRRCIDLLLEIVLQWFSELILAPRVIGPRRWLPPQLPPGKVAVPPFEMIYGIVWRTRQALHHAVSIPGALSGLFLQLQQACPLRPHRHILDKSKDLAE